MAAEIDWDKVGCDVVDMLNDCPPCQDLPDDTPGTALICAVLVSVKEIVTKQLEPQVAESTHFIVPEGTTLVLPDTVTNIGSVTVCKGGTLAGVRNIPNPNLNGGRIVRL